MRASENSRILSIRTPKKGTPNFRKLSYGMMCSSALGFWASGFRTYSKALYMGSCQNYGPFLGLYYNTAPIIYGTQKGTLILTTTHMV